MALSQLVDELPRYYIQKRKLSLDRDKLPDAIDILKKHFSDARLDESAGSRFNWNDKWLLLHPSNTEPIVRLIAETESPDATDALCNNASQALGRLT
jgi:phosphomannomutase